MENASFLKWGCFRLSAKCLQRLTLAVLGNFRRAAANEAVDA
jgi:hypothetical protein